MKPGSRTRDGEVLREYEQLFIYQMLKEMRKTVPDYGVVDSTHRVHFDEMLDDFLAGEMARSGQFGIADQLADQIALQKSGAQALAGASTAETGGIPLRKAVKGIPLPEASTPALPLPPRNRGIALYNAVAKGAPAHQRISE